MVNELFASEFGSPADAVGASVHSVTLVSRFCRVGSEEASYSNLRSVAPVSALRV